MNLNTCGCREQMWIESKRSKEEEQSSQQEGSRGKQNGGLFPPPKPMTQWGRSLRATRPPLIRCWNICDLLPRDEASRALRSSGAALLPVSRVNTRHGAAALACHAPHIWNKVPGNCSSAATLTSFKSRPRSPSFAFYSTGCSFLALHRHFDLILYILCILFLYFLHSMYSYF